MIRLWTMRRDVDDAPWRVQILGEDRKISGAGVLIGEYQILTCAHVVSAALDIEARPVPGTKVTVVVASHELAAQVAHWVPVDEVTGGGDIAVLRLVTIPRDPVAPARLSRSIRSLGRPVRTFGYPGRHDHGHWAEARVVGFGGAGHGEWGQLVGEGPQGHRIDRGFSGAGVIDRGTGSVIGLVVAAEGGEPRRVAWMLPIETVAKYWRPHQGVLPRMMPNWVVRLTHLSTIVPSLAVGSASAVTMTFIGVGWPWNIATGSGTAAFCYLLTMAANSVLEYRHVRKNTG